MRPFLFYIVLAMLALSSCGESKSGADIIGTVNGAENLSVYFDKLYPDGNSQSITQTSADASGNFSFRFEAPLDEGAYRVRIGAKSAFLIHKATDEQINITGNVASFNKYDYSVSGSPLSSELQAYMAKYINKEITIQDIQNSITSGMEPLMAMQVANILFKTSPQFGSTHAIVNKKLKASYPDADFTLRHTQMYSAVEAQIAASQRRTGKFKVGDIAPDIALPGPDGKVRRLSDLKGEVVLLDFWASWCGPCRRDNPKVVKTYHKFKDKGFNIFSVSLDGIHPRRLPSYKTQSDIDKQLQASKDRWVGAIEKDKLVWDNHVSELKHWNSAITKVYGISSIPQTFLIGKDGKIAAINPRFTLENELTKLL